MATIYTHAVVGLGLAHLYAARPMRWPFWTLAALLPVLPDLDVLSTAPYGSPWGHRGFTHSLLFAFVVSLWASGLSFRYLRDNPWRLLALFFLVTASHGLLDALTRGGESIPFFWPVPGRYGNWGPIPVSDLGFEVPDPRNSRALRAELLWVWLPTVGLAATVATYRFARRKRLAMR